MINSIYGHLIPHNVGPNTAQGASFHRGFADDLAHGPNDTDILNNLNLETNFRTQYLATLEGEPILVLNIGRSGDRSHRNIRATLERIRSREKRHERTRQETEWLRKNRRAYKNQWIALVGSELLAHGNSMKEVNASAKAAEQPLIMFIADPDQAMIGG
ncbi:MAG TPA: DUF5678 domain-containing protein [Granulicella sp.]